MVWNGFSPLMSYVWYWVWKRKCRLGLELSYLKCCHCPCPNVALFGQRTSWNFRCHPPEKCTRRVALSVLTLKQIWDTEISNECCFIVRDEDIALNEHHVRVGNLEADICLTPFKQPCTTGGVSAWRYWSPYAISRHCKIYSQVRTNGESEMRGRNAQFWYGIGD